MKTCKLLLTSALFFIASAAYSQEVETDKEAKAAISKLNFIVGDWAGTGWMMGRDGQKHTFNQTETIRFKLDSTSILIEGLGKTNGKIIHNAMAVLSFNKTAKHYTFRSYLSNGRGGEFKAELIENKLYWYPNENMRYIIYLNDKGQWYETGEMKRGEDWFQFLEMTLDKTSK